mgnify:CR=1 FL=1
MKVGIIVYSRTNHTISVAQKICDALISEHHDAEVLPITVKNDDPTTGEKIVLDKNPNYDAFDVIIFGSPVWAFSLCPVMKQYLSMGSSLSGKAVHCFVTHHFSFPFLGGNRSVRTMTNLCRAKEADVRKTGVVSWSSKKRASKIEQIVRDFSTIEEGKVIS